MARYIDADVLIKQMKDGKYVDRETSFQRGVNSAIDYWITEINHFPTADVVPKSEVERLEKDNEKLTVNMNAFGLAAKRLKEEKDALIKNYAECMKDYVREIFEEMQSCLIQRHWNGLDIVSFEFDAVKYAELKKKYTESEDSI